MDVKVYTRRQNNALEGDMKSEVIQLIPPTPIKPSLTMKNPPENNSISLDDKGLCFSNVTSLPCLDEEISVDLHSGVLNCGEVSSFGSKGSCNSSDEIVDGVTQCLDASIDDKSTDKKPLVGENLPDENNSQESQGHQCDRGVLISHSDNPHVTNIIGCQYNSLSVYGKKVEENQIPVVWTRRRSSRNKLSLSITWKMKKKRSIRLKRSIKLEPVVPTVWEKKKRSFRKRNMKSAWFSERPIDMQGINMFQGPLLDSDKDAASHERIHCDEYSLHGTFSSEMVAGRTEFNVQNDAVFHGTEIHNDERSNLPNIHKASHKRPANNIDLNKKQLQRPVAKKHRPKVIIEGKSIRTPNLKTPKPATPKKAQVRKHTVKKDAAAENLDRKSKVATLKKKNVRKNVNKHMIVKNMEGKSISMRNSCKRALKFDEVNNLGDESPYSSGTAIPFSTMLPPTPKGKRLKISKIPLLLPLQHEESKEFPSICQYQIPSIFEVQRSNFGEISTYKSEKFESETILSRNEESESSTILSRNEESESSNSIACFFKSPEDVLQEVNINYLIEKLKSLNFSDVDNHALGWNSINGAVVAINTSDVDNQALCLNSMNGAIVAIKKKKHMPKVDLDPETMKMWAVLMEDGAADDVPDMAKEKKWEEERTMFHGRIDLFTSLMHLILGDRRFSPWKGSVVDSVVGVFLTQNVSDHLSSSAYMSLAAKFPLRPTRDKIKCCEDVEISNSQESVGSNALFLKSVNCSITEQEVVCEVEQDMGEIGEEFLSTKAEEASLKETKTTPAKQKIKKGQKKEETNIDWDGLRTSYSSSTPRCADQMDSVDWDAVRLAKVSDVAASIEARGQHNQIALRIKDFLDRTVRLHKNIDLEWLRNVPPDDAKRYLLEIKGLGLKSVECVRLLALQHIAFPVDTNVGRIAVRLGWVPLRPLPEQLQIHLLEQYPIMDSIQKYLWPRLCTLDQRTLYELHYHMITFGKVFCTKLNPHCNACPMRGECKHFASAFASARLALPRPPEPSSQQSSEATLNSIVIHKPTFKEANHFTNLRYYTETSESIVEYPVSPKSQETESPCEPIIEYPVSPKPQEIESLERDIEEFGYNDDSDDIPHIKLDVDQFNTNVKSIIHKDNTMLQGYNICRDLVVSTPDDVSIPTKIIRRLRTEHIVYELSDKHPLLAGYDRRELDDVCPYLLAVWAPGEMANSFEPPKGKCNIEESGEICNDLTCYSCNKIREDRSNIVRGTILIPCRTAMKGRFPLNGTYFQVNEVFADHETSHEPIIVPKPWLQYLKMRIAYFGTSATSVFKGLSIREIQISFWTGYLCFRGFDRKTQGPKPVAKRFHLPKYMVGKAKREAKNMS